MPFAITDIDRHVYHDELEDFLPHRLIDVHTHVWPARLRAQVSKRSTRVVSWPMMVASDNPIEDLQLTYRLMFPGKEVSALCFSLIRPDEDFDRLNGYVANAVRRAQYQALLYAPPWWPADELQERVVKGGFLGIKVYLDLAPDHIPEDRITIFDFLPHEYLERADANRWIVMLHIPRPGRLGDETNLREMVRIDREYPNAQVIIAHVGRAYCEPDVGRGFEVLGDTTNLMIDFSANTNAAVLERLIRTVGPQRILFGSDLPITRMRMRRVCEGGRYVNLVPPGRYGDLNGDSHMREVEEGERLTFFLYEQLRAFRNACDAAGMGNTDISAMFHDNARRLLDIALTGR